MGGSSRGTARRGAALAGDRVRAGHDASSTASARLTGLRRVADEPSMFRFRSSSAAAGAIAAMCAVVVAGALVVSSSRTSDKPAPSTPVPAGGLSAADRAANAQADRTLANEAKEIETAGSDDSQSTVSHNTTQDAALAKRAVIKLGDFPAGWRADKSDPLEDPCKVYADLNLTATAQADFTQDDDDQVQSSARVFGSENEARTAIQRLQGDKVLG